MKKIVPDTCWIVKNGVVYKDAPITRITILPKSHAKEFHIVEGLKVLRLETPYGIRHLGIEDGRINSKLQMEVWGGFVNEKNELIKNWKDSEAD